MLLDDLRVLPAELLATRDPTQIAAALPPVVRMVPTEIGNGTVLETLGLAVGNALLDVLYNAPDFRYVKPLLEQGRLRIDAPSARAALDGIAAAGIAAGFGAAQAEAIKALADAVTPADEMTVRRVCWSDTGEWLP